MLTTLPGGYVIQYLGEVVGSVGVAGGKSGDPETPASDRYLAEVAIRSLGEGYSHSA